jgi:hypothetical protein
MKAGVAKTRFAASAVLTAAACIAGWLLPVYAIVPDWAGNAILVIMFPPFVLSLSLWWSAPAKEPDLPFLGY